MHRWMALAAAVVTALVFGVGAAAAGGAYPCDSAGAAFKPAAVPVLAAQPFALGEVDLAAIGVSPTELAAVGLAGATATSAGDGPNMFIVDDNRLDCPNAQFTSIQAAVTAAGPGD